MKRAATILIVDDEEPLRDFLCLLLEDLGHRVLQAANGRTGLELASAEHPDLVIADVMMPIMGGVELSQRLKNGNDGHRIGVILMSSAGPRVAEGAAADAFVSKPFDLEVIERLVEECLVAV